MEHKGTDPAEPASFDLILTGGHVLAPGDDLEGPLDIGIRNGTIAAIAPRIEGAATRTIDLRGATVTPGLIDLHTHVDFGLRTPGINARGADPDLVGVRSGVTTVVDAGTTGAYNFGGFAHYVIGKAKTRVLAFLHAGKGGISMEPDIRYRDDVDLEAFVKAVDTFPELIVGVKTRLMGPGVRRIGGAIYELARDAGRSRNLPVMVHMGEHWNRWRGSSRVTRDVLRKIEPGDIMEHLFTSFPGGAVDRRGRIMPELLEALDRGAVPSASTGGKVFLDFRVAQVLLDRGIRPAFLATDITIGGRTRDCFGLTETMSRALAMGFTLREVIALTTSEPARLINRQDTLGHLAVGREADLSVLGVIEGEWSYVDSEDRTIVGRRAIVPLLTVRGGEVFEPDWGPHPWGWLPEPGGYLQHARGSRSAPPSAEDDRARPFRVPRRASPRPSPRP
jgi:dihydroorotase